MGIFDFLRKSSPPAAAAAPPTEKLDKKVAGPAKVVADRRAQTYDRLEAIQSLVATGTGDAAVALLKRFGFSIDPSITDQEEKDLAFQGIIDACRPHDLPKDGEGRDKLLADYRARRDQVIDAVVASCARAEQLTWPLKVLRELLSDEDYTAELIALLEGFDLEYARNVEPKIQVLNALEDVRSPDVRESVERFLEDVNETVRFHAVETLFAQDDAVCVPKLVAMLAEEESVRVKNKVGEGLVKRGWVIPKELRDTAARALRDTEDYGVGSDGKVVRRSGR